MKLAGNLTGERATQCTSVAPGASANPRELRSSARSAFTMIEIAISLAVIGFALVAIIGIMPFAMGVQRENREETIINQDANVFLDVIRNGAQHMDDLTNYVVSITNAWGVYNPQNGSLINSGVYWYTLTDSYSGSGNPQFRLTNGMRIAGLLSTPKYMAAPGGNGVVSNYITAVCRAFSGTASEKSPQDNPDMRDLGLRYRLISEVVSYGAPLIPPRHDVLATNNATPPDLTNYAGYTSNTLPYITRATYHNYSTNLYQHLRDIRLIFRWPVLPNGTVPAAGGRQVYCTTVTGDLRTIKDGDTDLYFIQPTLFTTNSL